MCFAEAYHFLKAEGRKTTTRNADIDTHNSPEDAAKDAIPHVPQLEEKKERLADWLNSTFKMKRVNELNTPNDIIVIEGYDDDDHGILDPYVSVNIEDIESIDGKTDDRGLPFGRCTVTLHNGDDLFGFWRAGRREGRGNSSGQRLENSLGIKLIQGHYTEGRLQGRGSVKMVDGCQFDCDFVDSRAEGWVVSTFTRSLGDLETDTAREEHVVTGPFVAR